MARKRPGCGEELVGCALLLALVTASGAVIALWDTPDGRKTLAIAAAVFVGIPLMIWSLAKFGVSQSKRAARVSMREKVASLADAHVETLAKKRWQLVTRDDYDRVDMTKWGREVEYFVERIVLPQLNESEKRELLDYDEQQHVANNIIDARAKRVQESGEGEPVFTESMTPVEYEHFCAGEFRRFGWDAQVTVASGDQGVDVRATKGDRVLVAQCKLYTKPVGNKAVQEVIAGRAYERADVACVVSNAAFTRSARQLAKTARVHLVHHSEIGSVEAMAVAGDFSS